MKVPKPPPGSEPKLVYDKDRNATRRTVKGAAGGLLGVDYEDERRPDPTTEKATAGAGANREEKAPVHEAATVALVKKEVEKLGPPKAEAEMILDDEDATTRDAKARQRRRFVPRDRLTVDKDAPQLIRKRRWEESDDSPPEEPEEIDLGALAEAIAAGEEAAAAPRRIIGDPRLVEPHAIREAFGAPSAYAKHCLILAEAFRQETGADRDEAIRYLARLFAAIGDRGFARQALKELGPGTGIIDLYPLEVVEHVLEHHPGLLAKVGFGRLFARSLGAHLEIEAGVPSSLDYPPGLKLRGFAIKGGARPGYRFQPGERAGRYLLTIHAPGRYRLLISALTRSGHTVIDRVDVLVKDGPAALPPLPVPELVRDEAKIATWPMPEPLPVDYHRVLDDVDPRSDSGEMLSSGERISMQQRGLLSLSKDEAVEFVDVEETETPELEAVEEQDEEEVSLSIAETALLRVAVAINTDDEDVKSAEVTVPEQRAYTDEE